jgi:hypothetical protein
MSILQLALSPMPKVLLAGVMWNAQLNCCEPWLACKRNTIGKDHAYEELSLRTSLIELFCPSPPNLQRSSFTNSFGYSLQDNR